MWKRRAGRMVTFGGAFLMLATVWLFARHGSFELTLLGACLAALEGFMFGGIARRLIASERR